MPFAELATLLGVSVQTAARRYQRLVRDGVLRCTTFLNPQAVHGLDSWVLQITPKPGRGTALAAALTRHPGISWVNVTAGHVTCLFSARADDDRDDMLIERLPKTSLVQSVSAFQEVHRFPVSTAWPDFTDLLTPAQRGWSERRAHLAAATGHPDGPIALTGTDYALLRVLGTDARASHAAIAAHTGLPRSRVRDRLRELTDAGAVYFDLEVARSALGFSMHVTVTAHIAPRHLQAVGEALSANREIPFVCVTTGRTNIFAVIFCRTAGDYYKLLTGALAGITGLDELEAHTNLQQVQHLRTIGRPGISEGIASGKHKTP